MTEATNITDISFYDIYYRKNRIHIQWDFKPDEDDPLAIDIKLSVNPNITEQLSFIFNTLGKIELSIRNNPRVEYFEERVKQIKKTMELALMEEKVPPMTLLRINGDLI